ncbi:hypothetical protein ACQQ2T_07815 [Paraclostridium tenue]
MVTKDVTVLKNFSHVSGVYIRGEHHRIDEFLANQFIESNLVAPCNHTHVENVDEVIKSKSRGRRKKGDN